MAQFHFVFHTNNFAKKCLNVVSFHFCNKIFITLVIFLPERRWDPVVYSKQLKRASNVLEIGNKILHLAEETNPNKNDEIISRRLPLLSRGSVCVCGA